LTVKKNHPLGLNKHCAPTRTTGNAAAFQLEILPALAQQQHRW